MFPKGLRAEPPEEKEVVGLAVNKLEICKLEAIAKPATNKPILNVLIYINLS